MHFESPEDFPPMGGLKITIVEKCADGTCRISVYTAAAVALESGGQAVSAAEDDEEEWVALAS